MREITRLEQIPGDPVILDPFATYDPSQPNRVFDREMGFWITLPPRQHRHPKAIYPVWNLRSGEVRFVTARGAALRELRDIIAGFAFLAFFIFGAVQVWHMFHCFWVAFQRGIPSCV